MRSTLLLLSLTAALASFSSPSSSSDPETTYTGFQTSTPLPTTLKVHSCSFKVPEEPVIFDGEVDADTIPFLRDGGEVSISCNAFRYNENSTLVAEQEQQARDLWGISNDDNDNDNDGLYSLDNAYLFDPLQSDSGVGFSLFRSVLQKTQTAAFGGDTDAHGGCSTDGGYSWCESKGKCLRLWEEECQKGSGGWVVEPQFLYQLPGDPGEMKVQKYVRTPKEAHSYVLEVSI